MENQEGILFLIYFYLKPHSFIPIWNASSLIMHLILSLVMCILFEYLEGIQKCSAQIWHSRAWMSCKCQWQVWGCRCGAHLVSCHRGRKPTCLWARTGSPPASLPARGAPLACSHTGTGDSQWHSEMGRQTHLVQASTALLSASTQHRLTAQFHPLCPNPCLQSGTFLQQFLS